MRYEILTSLPLYWLLFLTIITGKSCVLLSSLQQFIEIEVWLLLTFFLCLPNLTDKNLMFWYLVWYFGKSNISVCFSLQKRTYKAFQGIATNCNNEINKLSLNIIIVRYFTITMKLSILNKSLNDSEVLRFKLTELLHNCSKRIIHIVQL